VSLSLGWKMLLLSQVNVNNNNQSPQTEKSSEVSPPGCILNRITESLELEKTSKII